MYTAFRYGGLSGATFWYMCDNLFDNATTPNKLFHVLANYYRFVRPGHVMVDVDDSGSDDMQALAFTGTNGALTVIVLNSGASAAPVTLSSPGLPPTFLKYTTSAGKSLQPEGTVSTGGPISVDAQSITTLYYSPEDVSVKGRTRSPLDAAATREGARSYDLLGRPLTPSANAPGRAIWATTVVANSGRTRVELLR